MLFRSPASVIRLPLYKYKSEVFQRQLTDEQQVTAEMYQEPPAFCARCSWGSAVLGGPRVVVLTLLLSVLRSCTK